MSTVTPFDAHEAANLASYHAERERIDGILLRTQRQKIREALTIGKREVRCRELAKIEKSLRDLVWPRSLADAAHLLAYEVHDAATYGGVARLSAFVGRNP